MNSACLRNRARNDSALPVGTMKVLARTMGPVFSLNCAKIDPSMVMRYYGNKAGLFAAAVSIDPQLPGLPVEPREAIGRTLVRHFLTLWEENGELTALMRVGATDPAAADQMQSVLRDQL